MHDMIDLEDKEDRLDVRGVRSVAKSRRSRWGTEDRVVIARDVVVLWFGGVWCGDSCSCVCACVWQG